MSTLVAVVAFRVVVAAARNCLGHAFHPKTGLYGTGVPIVTININLTAIFKRRSDTTAIDALIVRAWLSIVARDPRQCLVDTSDFYIARVFCAGVVVVAVGLKSGSTFAHVAEVTGGARITITTRCRVGDVLAPLSRQARVVGTGIAVVTIHRTASDTDAFLAMLCHSARVTIGAVAGIKGLADAPLCGQAGIGGARVEIVAEGPFIHLPVAVVIQAVATLRLRWIGIARKQSEFAACPLAVTGPIIILVQAGSGERQLNPAVITFANIVLVNALVGSGAVLQMHALTQISGGTITCRCT